MSPFPSSFWIWHFIKILCSSYPKITNLKANEVKPDKQSYTSINKKSTHNAGFQKISADCGEQMSNQFKADFIQNL